MMIGSVPMCLNKKNIQQGGTQKFQQAKHAREKENVALKCTLNDYLVQDGGFHNIFCECPTCLSVSYIIDSTHECLSLLITTCHVVIGCDVLSILYHTFKIDHFVTLVSEGDHNGWYFAKI